MNYPEIEDLFGNKIEITSVDEAIELASTWDSVHYNTTPFYLKDGVQCPIPGRGNEIIPLALYWEDSLSKLRNLKNGIKTSCTLATNKNGYYDFCVSHSDINRACVPKDIQIDDQFNVYHGESSKSGIKWKGDLLSSIEHVNM